MAKKEKEEAQETNDFVEGFFNANKDDHFNNIVPRNQIISTGSLTLDSLVKIRSGGVVRLVGAGAELGKTSEAFVLATNYMKVMPKSKTLFIKAESRLGEEMRKRSGMRFVNLPSEWEYGTTLVFSCNIFEVVAKFLETLLPKAYKNGEYICVIIDSMDGLILKSDYEKDIFGDPKENVKVAGVPLLTKLLFRRLGLKIVHYDTLLIITGQYSANISLDPYAKAPARQVDASGGSAIQHQCDYVFSYAQRFGGDWILEKPDDKPDRIKNKTLGVLATLDIKKSGTDASGTRVKIPIARGRIGNQIWTEKEVVDMVLQHGLAARLNGKGAWYNFDEYTISELKKANLELKEAHQGVNALYKYFEENKDICDWFYKKFSDMNAADE